jgi:hypothetical protein
MKIFGLEISRAKREPLKPEPSKYDTLSVDVGRVVAGQQDVEQTRVDPNFPMYRPNRGLNQDVLQFQFQNADVLIKQLASIDPDMSAGIWNFLRLADSGITATALDANFKPSQTYQRTLDAMLGRACGLGDYANWDIRLGLGQQANQLMRYLLLRGSCALETVLGDDRRLYKFVGVDPYTVHFKQPERGKFRPWQRDLFTGQEVFLDIPTFFWQVLDPDTGTPFENPPFLPAVQAILFNMSVMQDLQRIVKRVAYPRISIKIIEATLRKFAPPAAQADPKQMTIWLNQQKQSIGNSLRDIKPEDAAVFFDSIELGVLESKSNASVDYKPLIQVIDQRVVSGLKTLPTILGRQFGSGQTVSGVEALLYAKSVACAQQVVETLLARALTFCMRLEGKAAFVQVKYGEVSLRPSDELESFKALKQARILKNLSLGFISDEDASIALTGNPFLQPNHIRLAGTGFYPLGAGALDPNAVEADRSTTGANAGSAQQGSQGNGSSTGRAPNAEERAGGGRVRVIAGANR